MPVRWVFTENRRPSKNCFGGLLFGWTRSGK